MKVQVGSDIKSGFMNTASVTYENASGIGQLPSLLREDDRVILGGSGYVNHTIGGVVTTAQALMEIVPADTIEMEANVSNQGIGFVNVRQAE